MLADGTGTTRQHRDRERTVLAIAQRLAAGRLGALPAIVTAREADGSIASSRPRAAASQPSNMRRSRLRAVRNGPQLVGSGSPSRSLRNVAEWRLSLAATATWLK